MAISPILNHTMSTLRDFISLGFEDDYPRTIYDIPRTVAKLEAIIDEQQKKTFDVDEANNKKREKLEEQLGALLKRDQELRSNPPAGWKPPKASNTATAN